MSDHSHDIHDDHGHGSLKTYLSVFVALCILTAVSFAVGSSKELRENAPAVMMAAMIAVSCAKASLVILFFMHMKYEANWKYVLTVPASIMSLFLMFMLWPDVGRRTVRYTEERWLSAAQHQDVEAAFSGEAPKEHHPATDKGHGKPKSGH